MDYSSESELIESLDYLTLPVKRSGSIGKGSSLCENNKTRFLRDFRNISHKTQTSHSLHKCSDSLILNNTKEEIVECYAIVSETSSDKYLGYLQSKKTLDPIQPKSLIKVTVTPKKTKPHKLNVFTRRKQNSKHLHNTISVEDRSIQTKHMCLVVTGRKRERQYNIKTTESAKLLNDIHKVNDDISLDQVKSVKHVIHSLNMDKKRKKSPANKRTGSPPKTSKGTAKKIEKDIQANTCQSVVRITGQIGLGEDNQILVRCGVEGAKGKLNNDVKGFPRTNYVKPNAGTLLHTVNQGTQMDINLVDNAPNRKVPFYSNNVTCFCNDVNNVNQFETPFKDPVPIKRCQSPLVVITVYPNDERCENVKIFKQHTRCRSNLGDNCGSLTNVNCMLTNRNNEYQVDEECVDKIKIESKDGTRKIRSRSASRSRKGKKSESKDKKGTSRPRSGSRSSNSSSSQNVKRQGPKKTNSAVRPKSPRNQSPSRNSAQHSKPKETENRQTRSKTHSPDTNNQKAKRQEAGKNKISRKTKDKNEEKNVRSPSSSRSPSLSIHSNHNVKRQNTEIKHIKGKEARQRGFQKKEKENKANLTSIATNTDHVLTKKALVDTFTKEIMGQMGNHSKNNCKKPQFTESQLEINIEGEDENYDVFLQQGRLTTDVRVKRTKYPSGNRDRIQSCQYPDPINNYNTKETSKSLLNMIDIDDFRNYGHESPTTKHGNFEMPGIKVRDSLEIGHKRKDHTPHNTRKEIQVYGFENGQQQEAGVSESFAPIKHYRGDKCFVPDPIKRDREVRQLLGLEVPTRKECRPCPCPMARHKNYEPGWPCELYQVNDNCRTRKKITTQDEPRINHIKNKMTTLTQTTGTQYEAPNFNTDCPLSKKMILNRNIQVFLQVEKFTEEKPIILSRQQYHKVKKAIEHTICKHPKNKLAKPKSSVMNTVAKRKVNNKPIEEDRIEKPNHINIYAAKSKEVFASEETAILYTRAFIQTKAQANVSAADMRMSHFEPLNESSTKVAVGSSYSHSIHTIFKGLKKPRTPNLGTSVCSFFSNSTNEYHECKSVKNFKPPLDKPRRPFLKRLMSCLILRASTASEAKLSAMPRRKSSYNSSIDSYHISTSLGAIEMSSSIYDTSESFYSNHSIVPINSKIKKERGFFGSMRGLLTGRN